MLLLLLLGSFWFWSCCCCCGYFGSEVVAVVVVILVLKLLLLFLLLLLFMLSNVFPLSFSGLVHFFLFKKLFDTLFSLSSFRFCESGSGLCFSLVYLYLFNHAVMLNTQVLNSLQIYYFFKVLCIWIRIMFFFGVPSPLQSRSDAVYTGLYSYFWSWEVWEYNMLLY